MEAATYMEHIMELELRSPHIIVRCSCGWAQMLPEQAFDRIDVSIQEHRDANGVVNHRIAVFKQAMSAR